MARILTEESSLTRRRTSLEKETRVLQRLLRVEAGLALLLTLAGAGVWIWKGTGTVLGLGLAMGVFYVAHRLRIQQNSREEKIVQAGLRGEVEVTRQLAESLDNEHYILNDLLIKHGRKTAQIDHLIVSPRGLFAIETKNWRGHIAGHEDEARWTQTKEPGMAPLKVFNPIRQTKRHVDLLRQALLGAGIDWPDIFSVVVFLSPKTTFDVPDATIPVLRPQEAVRFIAEHEGGRAYSEAEVSALVNWLMRSK